MGANILRDMNSKNYESSLDFWWSYLKITKGDIFGSRCISRNIKDLKSHHHLNIDTKLMAITK